MSPIEHAKRAGVTIDVADMTISQLAQLGEENQGQYMDVIINEAYLLTECRLRGHWKEGLNHRPNSDDFVRYINNLWPNRDYTKARVTTAVSVYNFYSNHEKAEVLMELIKSMEGLTKPFLALSYAEAHPNDVEDILAICKRTPRADLRPILSEKYPLRSRSAREDVEHAEVSAINTMLIKQLDSRRSGALINNKFFIPRSAPWDIEYECGAYALAMTTIESGIHATVDELFSDMVDCWLEMMGSDERRELLTLVKGKWNTMMEMKGGNQLKFPYAKFEQ